MKGSGVVFTHGEGISTPHVRHKGRQPLIECANMTLIFSSLLCPYSLYTLFIFFSFFCGRQGCFPLLLRIPQFGMRKSDLRSSLEQGVWLSCFCLFAKYVFIEQKVI